MSSAQFNAGQTHGQAQGKAEEWMESVKGTANAAHDKACDMAGNTQGQAQRSKEENTAFLQQKGEQMAHMAQDAIDGVKNSLGMGNNK
ncbi:ABA-inducible protein PHV A1 [Sesamum indicum]|uniref:ABA-inducible protein PHV A1 n=1 Tax=Sesamum indicum TaxID=4182 RepID=A0A6I9ST55_SESIN|nr:ABA-inducible protein PHV A1 [Sesamum indicum]